MDSRNRYTDDYVLGIDIGTTSVKTVLLSREGIVDEASRPHDLVSLHPGWAEEDADIWWENTKACLRELTGRDPERAAKIRCIGCSGMVPAIVLLDREGHPVRKTIQQNDARSTAQIERLLSELDQDALFERTGGRTNQQHVLPRLLWVKENEPEVWTRVCRVMGSYDYISCQLTGAQSLEVNWAVESGSFDIRTRKWMDETLRPYGLDASLFPPVHMPMDVIGETRAECAALGLAPGIPVIAGSADHVASTLAAGIINPGDLLIKFGGAGDILYCTDRIATDPRLFFDYHDVPDRYLLNGCMAASGSLVKWFVHDIIQAEDPGIFRQLDLEAEKVPAASDGLIILPYFLGEKTPVFDPQARGVMVGLTLSHTKAHIFRAILESVIYGFRHHIDVLAEAGFVPENIIATNGGAKSRFWCQIAADVLGRPVTSYRNHPGSSLGIAFLAGMKAGLFQRWEEIRGCLPEAQHFEPDPENCRIYDHSYRIYRELYPTLKDTFDSIGKIY